MATKANFSAYHNYVTDSLHQWDLNQVLTVQGLNLATTPEVHFSNKNMDRAIVRQATMENHVVTVNIPNTLLQHPLRIYAHIGIYEGETFKVVELVEIPVIPRVRPCDYQFEDTDGEIYSYNRLENMIENINKTWYDMNAQQVQATVTGWLDAHPEATTTVQDGSLAVAKFTDELKLQTIKDYVTPQMFGAKGDGVTDDTQAFVAALATKKKVYVPAGLYSVGSMTIPENATVELAGRLHNSHAEAKTAEYYADHCAVVELRGTVNLLPHVAISGGVFFTAGVAFLLNVADYEYQGVNLSGVTVIGDGSKNAVGVLFDASDNSTEKTGYLTLSTFDMLICKCYYGYRINRPQTTGRHPWITFVTFKGGLNECYQGVSTAYGSIAHANGSGVYDLVCCGGKIYENAVDAYIDISGDMPVVNCLLSDIGADHSIKYGFDLTGTVRPTVYNYQQGNALFKTQALSGERFAAGGILAELTNAAMPDGKVFAVRSGGAIVYTFTGTFCRGDAINFGVTSPYARAAIDTVYTDPDTGLLIRLPGNNFNVLVSNTTRADITLSKPIVITVPHYTIN